MKSDDQIRTEVREHYSAIARNAATASRTDGSDQTATACCGPSTQSGCCAPAGVSATDATRRLGYSDAELAAAPQTANLGLGCGNPQAIAELRAGEVVVDLGAGGGFDAFLAARAVGPSGRVIGVDMSADMVALARENARKQRTRIVGQGASQMTAANQTPAANQTGAAVSNVELRLGEVEPNVELGLGEVEPNVELGLGEVEPNVEFRLGEIEHMPIADATADVLISNCVINLAPDKRAVYAEALRVLKPGGRIAISDVVALAPMPQHLAEDVAARCGCIAGAALASELEPMLRSLGFVDVAVEIDPASREVIDGWAPGAGLDQLVASARIRATKPGARRTTDSDVDRTMTGLASSSSQASGDATAKPAGACCAPGCCS